MRTVTRRPLLRVVLCALVLSATILLQPVPSAEAQPQPAPSRLGPTTASTASDSTPVALNQLRPSTLRPDRPVSLGGVVRNTTEESWGAVQVSMVITESPVTTAEGVREARNDRGSLALRAVLGPGDFQNLGDLAPGEEAEFSLRNAWDSLPITGSSGVYIVGVEVRAFDEDGLRNTVGESSAFVPLIGPESGTERVRMAMVLPLTAGVPLAAGGYANDALAQQFQSDGRLTALADLGASAGDFPLTWVVDPAVADAATDMADGYRMSGGAEVAADDERADAARLWLSRVQSAVTGQDVLTLPYGDPDVASLARDGLQRALTPTAAATSAALAELELPEQNLLWPANGWLDRRTRNAASRIAPAMTLVATDSVRPPRTPGVYTTGREGEATPTIVYDRRALSPRASESTLQWRQQLLAQAAVTALDGGGSVVVVPPRTLTPSAQWAESEFFAGLDTRWLRPTRLSAIADRADAPQARLRYPRRARRSELPVDNRNAVAALVRTSRTLIGVLAEPEGPQLTLAKATGIASSLHWRDVPDFGLVLGESYVEENRTQLDQVQVEAPAFITLSGQEGPFPVTVSNGLKDEAITVSIEAQTSDDALRVEPIDQVTIEPEQRRSIPVRASYEGVGISNVTVRLLDRNGSAFGDPVTLRVRATQIGAVIWVVMGIGAAIIFGAAGRSVVRRVRAREAAPTSRETSA